MKGVFVKLKLLKHMFFFSQPSLSIKSRTLIRKTPPNKFSNIPSVFPMCIFIFPSFHPFSSMLPMFPSNFIHVFYFSILFAINFVRPHPFFSEYIHAMCLHLGTWLLTKVKRNHVLLDLAKMKAESLWVVPWISPKKKKTRTPGPTLSSWLGLESSNLNVYFCFCCCCCCWCWWWWW